MTASDARAHVVHHRVVFGETDAAGVVFYPNYLRWFDQGTHELFRALEVPLGTVRKEWGVVLPVVSVRADFRAPLFYDDEIGIRSAVGGLTSGTITLLHQITREDREVCAGQEVRGCVVAENGVFVARPLPDELRRRLA